MRAGGTHMRRKASVFAHGLIGLALASSPARAQAPWPAEVAPLPEATPAAAPAPAAKEEKPPAEKKPDFKPKPQGYIETFFLNDQSDVDDKATSQFKIRRARIGLKGDVHEWVSYNIVGAFEGAFKKAVTEITPDDPKTPEDESAVTTDTMDSNARLWHAYIDFKPHDLIGLRVGQFKYPFTLEGLEATPDRAPILRAEAINGIAGKLISKGSGFRDIGAQLFGTWKGPIGVSYTVAFFNGTGINANDNNNKKDVAFRLDLSPIEGLTLGGSAFRGWAEARGQDAVDEVGFGAHAEYLNKSLGLHLRAEWLQGKFDVPATDTAPATEAKPWGWYVQGGYAMPFHKPLEALVRYDFYEEDKNKDDTTLGTVTVGTRYVITGKTRIALNYLIRNPSANVKSAQEQVGAGDKIDNLLLLQFLAFY